MGFVKPCRVMHASIMCSHSVRLHVLKEQRLAQLTPNLGKQLIYSIYSSYMEKNIYCKLKGLKDMKELLGTGKTNHRAR